MTTASILEALAGSPVGQEIIARHAADALEARRQLVEGIAAAHAKWASEEPSLDEAITTSQRSVAGARRFLERTEKELADRLAERARQQGVRDLEVNRCERDLRKSADPRIGEFIAAVELERHRVRASGKGSHIDQRVAQLDAALSQARPLAIQAVDVQAALAAIRQKCNLFNL